MKARRTHKRLMALILAFLMVFTTAMPVWADYGEYPPEYENELEENYQILPPPSEETPPGYENGNEPPELESAVAANFQIPMPQSATPPALLPGTDLEMGEVGSPPSQSWSIENGEIAFTGASLSGNPIGGNQVQNFNTLSLPVLMDGFSAVRVEATFTAESAYTGGSNGDNRAVLGVMVRADSATANVGTAGDNPEPSFAKIFGRHAGVNAQVLHAGPSGTNIGVSGATARAWHDGTEHTFNLDFIPGDAPPVSARRRAEVLHGVDAVIARTGATGNDFPAYADISTVHVGLMASGVNATFTAFRIIATPTAGGQDVVLFDLADLDTGTGPAPPPAPSGLSVAPGYRQVTLNWGALSAADSFEVNFREYPGGTQSPSWTAVSDSANSHTFTELTNGQEYMFYVRGRNDEGPGAASHMNATPLAPPTAAPTGLTVVSAVGGRVALSWTGAASAASYDVQWREAGEVWPAEFTTTAENALTHTVTGLTDETEYEFRVRGRNAGGYGPWSATVTATPEPRPPVVLPAPWRVTNIFNTAPAGIRERFAAGIGYENGVFSLDTRGGVDGFAAGDGNGSFAGNNDQIAFISRPIPNNVDFTISGQITIHALTNASNQSGIGFHLRNSVEGANLSAPPTGNGPPSPANTAAYITAGVNLRNPAPAGLTNATVGRSRASDGGSAAGAESFTQIANQLTLGVPFPVSLARVGNDFTITSNGTTHQLNDFTGFTGDADGFIHIGMVNSRQVQASFTDVSLVLNDFDVPPVTNLTAHTGIDGEVNLTWDGWDLATGFEVAYGEYPVLDVNTLTPQDVGNVTSFIIDGLTNDVDYDFFVRTNSHFGNSEWVRVIATPVYDPRELEDLRSGEWFESVYATWTAEPGDDTFAVLVSPAGLNSWTAVDAPLARLVDPTRGTWRVDVPGLAANNGQEYDIRIMAQPSGIISTITGLAPDAFDRQGFAFAPGNGRTETTGGHNSDGSVPENAQIIYVTHENMNTVLNPAWFPTSGSASTSGLAADNRPLIIRFIGQVGTLGFVGDRSGIPLAANNDNHFLTIRNSRDITLEGVGPDAVIYGWGFQIHSSSNVVVRNLTFDMFFEDAVGLHAANEHENSHFWVHHNTIRYGQDRYTHLGHEEDMRYGDGGVDVTNWGGFFTISYNRFFGTDKSMLLGNNIPDQLRYGTVHHNWFYRSDSRLPRVRNGWVHVFNNLYQNVGDYGIGAGHMANIIAEGNTFVNVRRPFIISGQGHANNFAPPGAGSAGNSLSTDFPGAIVTSEVANSAALAGHTLQPNVLDTFSRGTFNPNFDIGASSHADNRIGEHTFIPFRSGPVGIDASGTLSSLGVQTAADAEARVRAASGPMGAPEPQVAPRPPVITHLSINHETRAGTEGQHVIIQEGTFVISWSGDVLAEEFIIEWDMGSGTWQQVATIPQSPRPNTYNTTTQVARPGGTYAFRITAVNAQGAQTSEIVSVTYVTPNPPTNLIASVADGGLLLSWTPPAEGPVPADYEVRVTMIETELGTAIVGAAPVIVTTPETSVTIMNLPVGLFRIEVRSRVGANISEPLTGEYRTLPWRIPTADLSVVQFEENFRTWDRGRITPEQAQILGISVINTQPGTVRPNENWTPTGLHNNAEVPPVQVPIFDPDNINNANRAADNHRHDVFVDDFGLKLYDSGRGQSAADSFGTMMFIDVPDVSTGRVIVDADIRVTRSSTMSSMVPIRLYSAGETRFAERTIGDTFAPFAPMGTEHVWDNEPSDMFNVQIVIDFDASVYDFIVNGVAVGLGADQGFGTLLPDGITSLGWVSAGTATGNASGHAYSESSITFERISVRTEGEVITPEVQPGGVNFIFTTPVNAIIGTTAVISKEVQPTVIYTIMQAEWLKDGEPVSRGDMDIRPLVGGGYLVSLIMPGVISAAAGSYTLSVTLLNDLGQPLWESVSNELTLNVQPPPPGENGDVGEPAGPPPRPPEVEEPEEQPEPPTIPGPGPDEEPAGTVSAPGAEPAPWTPPEALPVPPSYVTFYDVPYAAWYTEYITRVVAHGIFRGTGIATFEPDGVMTRGMFAQVLANMQGVDISAFAGGTTFADVEPAAWYNMAVEWAAYLGIVRGIDENTFAPHTPITREQMAVMLHRFIEAMGIELPIAVTGIGFADQASISPWAQEAVAFIQAAGIISGRADGTFDPQAVATRAEVAAIFARLLGAEDRA